MNAPTILTQIDMNEAQLERARTLAARLGFQDSTAYTSTSALIGLNCLPLRSGQHGAVIVQTAELGMLVIATLEDVDAYDLFLEEHAERVSK
jgi:hypothetical protein